MRFEKIHAQYPDVIREKTSVQITEELRIFKGFQNYGAGGFAQFLGIFQKRYKITAHEQDETYPGVLGVMAVTDGRMLAFETALHSA